MLSSIVGQIRDTLNRRLPHLRQWLGSRESLVSTLVQAFASRRLQWFPLVPILRSYTREMARADLRAGVNVALVAFPQGIAYALVAGLPPQYGLISAGLGTMVAGAFSGTRLIVIGPGNSTAILIFSGLVAAGLSEEQRILALPLFVFLVGCFQLIGALANLSLVINYVSRSVVTAYLTAAAALIVVAQLQNLMGFRVEEGATFFSILTGTVRHLHEARPVEMVLGLVSLLAVIGIRRFFPRLPYAAVTLVTMGMLATALQWADIPVRHLASFSLGSLAPLAFAFDFDLLARLAGPAFAVAFVGLLEGASVGRSFASRSGERLNVSQVMLGMGMANLANSVCGGMDASGSITRSALNYASGARTALSTIFSGAITLLLLFTLGPLIEYIPKTALAAVILYVACSLVHRHHIRVALRATRSDALVFVLTLGSATLFALDTAIYIGVFTSIVLFLRKAGVPELIEYQFNDEGQLAEVRDQQARSLPGISILHAEGDLFFGSTELFSEQARQAVIDPSLRLVILRLKNARHIDASATLAIEELHQVLRGEGRHLLISGASREIFRVFRNSGLLETLGRENFFMHVPSNPTLSTRNALQRARRILGHGESDIRIFLDKRRQDQPAGSA